MTRLKDLYIPNVIVLHLKTDWGYLFFFQCLHRACRPYMDNMSVSHVHMNEYKNIDFPLHALVFIAMFPYLFRHRKLCNTFDVSPLYVRVPQAIV